MPLPLLFMGLAALTGTTGVGVAAKSLGDQRNINKINELSDKQYQKSCEELEKQKEDVTYSLTSYGKLKQIVLESTINDFVNSFNKIRNIPLDDSVGIDELKIHFDKKEFTELQCMVDVAKQLGKGAIGGTVLGTSTAYLTYGAVTTYASASTGTAISTLSGIAAKNATLAWFGGGSIASGGLGMSVGQVVLGGIAVGPALLVMGLYTGIRTQEEVEKALANKDKRDVAIKEMSNLAYQCSAIRRRTYMFYALLSKFDNLFISQIEQMKQVIESDGEDWHNYKKEAKEKVGMALITAKTIKAILDTPILSENGSLTEEAKLLLEHYMENE